MRTIHFISGLPRSGSTLLCNLLAQNPNFQVAGTSGLVDMLVLVRNSWDQLPEFLAMPPADSEAAKLRVLRAMMGRYHPPHRPIVFDKSRSWLAFLEMAEAILGGQVKVIVPVRDIRAILASFEMLWRRCSATRQFPHERKEFLRFQSVEERCAYWMSAQGVVGIADRRLKDAIRRGYGNRLHLVPFENLTEAPEATMSYLYSFLGEPHFAHDFERVKNVTKENDLAYGIPGLHDVRESVEPSRTNWQAILGTAGIPYVPQTRSDYAVLNRQRPDANDGGIRQGNNGHGHQDHAPGQAVQPG